MLLKPKISQLLRTLFHSKVYLRVPLQLHHHKLGRKSVVVVAAQGILKPRNFLVSRVQLHFKHDLAKSCLFSTVDKSY